MPTLVQDARGHPSMLHSSQRALPRPPSTAGFALVGIIAAALLLGAGLWVIEQVAQDRRMAARERTLERLQAAAWGRAATLETWMERTLGLTDRLANSQQARLFFSELALARGEPRLEEALAAQLPYMQSVLNEFAAREHLHDLAVLDSGGNLLLRGGNIAEPGGDVARLAGRLLDHRSVGNGYRLVDVVGRGASLVASFVRPVMPLQASSAEDEASAFLLVSIDITGPVSNVLTTDARDGIDDRVALIIDHGATKARLSLAHDGLKIAQWAHESSVRPIEGSTVFVPVATLNGGIEQSSGLSAALVAVVAFERHATQLLTATTLLLVSGGLALWWRLANRHHRALACAYRDFAIAIERERQLLESICANLPEMIGLTDAKGAYRYVNPSFKAALGNGGCGRTHRNVAWRDSAAVIEIMDERAGRGEVATCSEQPVTTAFGARFFDLTCVALPGVDNRPGPERIHLARDVTERVLQRQAHDRLTRGTTEVLIRSVECVDPYLIGHSERMAQLGDALAGRSGCDATIRRTVVAAARLSQIGKLFIAPEVVKKQSRHTPEETEVMRAHVSHAFGVLEAVGIDREVRHAIAQMNERLDGSGYPRALKGASIGQAARILAVADTICARIAPRSYRDPIDVEEAIAILLETEGRYDPVVLSALEALFREGFFEAPAFNQPDPTTVVVADDRVPDPRAVRLPEDAHGATQPGVAWQGWEGIPVRSGDDVDR